MEKKLKVVWVCHFSDQKTRNHIEFANYTVIGLLMRLLHRLYSKRDFAIWISNAIKEFEKFENIGLTIIFPHSGIKGRVQQFCINNIDYKCFKSEDDNLISLIKRKLFGKSDYNFSKNRQIIKKLISDISPDIVHVIGAENPYYSLSALDVPDTIPCVVSLQTLMSDPEFVKNYRIEKRDYINRSQIEAVIIKTCNYIGSPVLRFKDIVKRDIKETVTFLNMTLAVGQDLYLSPVKKEFDFVYFAANIEKAADYAIEAFALACMKQPGLSLNISGACTNEYKQILYKRIEQLKLKDNIVFTGPKVSHEDVLNQIKKSHFAILPLKIDLITGTIREAMACGIPVVTTITPATPDLNKYRESVLLSEKGDFQAMANNMLRLVENEEFAKTIRDNAIKTIQNRYSNEQFMQKWREAYYEIMDNFKYGTPFSADLIL